MSTLASGMSMELSPTLDRNTVLTWEQRAQHTPQCALRRSHLRLAGCGTASGMPGSFLYVDPQDDDHISHNKTAQQLIFDREDLETKQAML